MPPVQVDIFAAAIVLPGLPANPLQALQQVSDVYCLSVVRQIAILNWLVSLSDWRGYRVLSAVRMPRAMEYRK
jgi:hypothetical protein